MVVAILALIGCSIGGRPFNENQIVGDQEPTEDLIISTQKKSPTPTFSSSVSIFPTVTVEPTRTQDVVDPEIDQIQHLYSGLQINSKVDFRDTEVKYGDYGVVYRSDKGYITVEESSSWRFVEKYFPVQVSENEGVYLRFKVSVPSRIRIYFSSRLDDDTELRWGFLPYHSPQIYVKQGDLRIFANTIGGNLKLQPDQWYDAVIDIRNPGRFRVVIWDPLNTENKNEYQQNLSGVWSSQLWDLEVRVASGHISIQELMEFHFDEIK